MTVRRFIQADSDFILCGIGGVAPVNLGACTIAVLTKKELDGGFLPMVVAEITGSSARRSLMTGSTDLITGQLGGFSIPTPVTFDIADGWAVAAMSKAAGDVNLRGHKGVVGGVWTHGENTEGFDDGETLTGIRIGSHADSSSFDSGLYAVVAIWLSQLADADFSTNDLRASIHNWAALDPDFIVLLNQPSTSIGLRDLSGNGGNQSAISGTSVITNDDPVAGFFDGNVDSRWQQTNANSSTGVTLNGLQDFVGKRLMLAVYDRNGGETVSLSGTDAGLVSALGSPVVDRVTSPTVGTDRRSVWLYSCVIPSVAANPIVAPTVEDGSSVEQGCTVLAWVVDIDSSYELSAVASADSGASTVTSQVTGATPNATAGDHVVAVAAVVRGDGTTDWTDSKRQPWGLFDLQATTGTGASQLHAVGGNDYVAGGSAVSYEDTLNLGTARMVSAVIAVFSTGGSGGATVTLSPGSMTFTPVPLTPVPGVVTVALSPGVMTFSPVSMVTVPGVVTVDLSPGVMTFQPVVLTPLSSASFILSPGVLDFQAVPFTFAHGVVTMDLSPGVLTFVPVPVGELGAEVDVNVIVHPSRIGSMLVAQSRANGMSVNQTREARGD